MSDFAPITAALLARKGEASPSAPQKKPLFVLRATPTPAPAPAPVRAHRMTVTLRDDEYQALGIAAVKQGVTRRRIVRDALESHLAQLAREYGACACIGLGQSCAGSCKDHAQS